tara:strand:- start:442 stop:1011 length:570 start_codon:yes stop_codon:yes gene_type:complete
LIKSSTKTNFMNKNSLSRKNKVGQYDEFISELDENEVFVFGSNLDGFHGAGSAGFASFNIAGNHWRASDYGSKPKGWLGFWNKKGQGEGPQKGTHGKSYALPTVNHITGDRMRSSEDIADSIKKLYTFAVARPKLNFLVAQDVKNGLNGHAWEEMAQLYSSHPIPENMYFYAPFAKYIVGLKSNNYKTS